MSARAGSIWAAAVVVGCGPSAEPTDPPSPRPILVGTVSEFSLAGVREAGFGSSLASAGDIDGDGYADIVIGAPGIDRAFLLRGGPDGASFRDQDILAGDSGSGFGTTVAGAGDTDGDGYSDIVVGIPGARAALLFPGSPGDPTDEPIALAPPGDTGGEFGAAVASAGDVDGDGLADVAVGAPGCAGSLAGEVFVFLGAGGPAIRVTSEEPGFGSRVASAGDVNRDGLGDLAVGAPACADTAMVTGIAYVYHGDRSRGLTEATWIPETTVGASFGSAISGAGDVDGDGFGDLLVGEPGAATGAGAFYLYRGSTNGLSRVHSQQVRGAAGANLGAAVAGAGDVNGDGFADTLAGAPTDDASVMAEGTATVHRGGRSGGAVAILTVADRLQAANQTGARFGGAVAFAGDVNGDGLADLVIGADAFNGENDTTSEGRVFVVPGATASSPAAAPWQASPIAQAGAQFGRTVEAVPDVDGDGYAELAVAAIRADGQIRDEGQVFLYEGIARGLEVVPSWTADPADQVDARFGDVIGGGDVDGDGFADVAIGAPRWDGEAVDEGRVFLYAGGATGLALTPVWSAEPADVDAALFGVAIGFGDVNGDGLADLIVGADGWAGDDIDEEGRLFIYHGRKTGLPAEPSLVLDPLDEPGQFGDHVAITDADGDGFDDVVVGAPGWRGDQGIALLYLGGPDGLATTAAWQSAPEEAGSRFGDRISSGDFDADGFGDVAIAAHLASGDATAVGKIFVYRGGRDGLTDEPLVLQAHDLADSQLGVRLAPAGDTNGDGFDDLVASSRETAPWAVGLFLGSPDSLSSQPRWTLPPGSGFGSAITGAADFNGDAFADVAIGEPLFDMPASDVGRAFAHLGSDGTAGVDRGLTQRDAGSGAAIASGGALRGDIELSAAVAHDSPIGGMFRLEFEIVGAGSRFSGLDTRLSPPVPAGERAAVIASGLAPGAYRWRVRTVHTTGLARGRWLRPDRADHSRADFRIATIDQTSFYGCAATPSVPAAGWVWASLLAIALLCTRARARPARRGGRR